MALRKILNFLLDNSLGCQYLFRLFYYETIFLFYLYSASFTLNLFSWHQHLEWWLYLFFINSMWHLSSEIKSHLLITPFCNPTHSIGRVVPLERFLHPRRGHKILPIFRYVPFIVSLHDSFGFKFALSRCQKFIYIWLWVHLVYQIIYFPLSHFMVNFRQSFHFDIRLRSFFVENWLGFCVLERRILVILIRYLIFYVFSTRNHFIYEIDILSLGIAFGPLMIT